MRIDLTDDNLRKATEAERQLRERYGVSLSPTQIVNIAFSAIEQIELQQTVIVTFKPATPQTSSSRPPAKKIIRKTTNWVTNIK